MTRLTCLSPIIDGNSRVLILGTMPGEQSLQKQQYYANPGNHFWKIVYGVFHSLPEQDYDKRVAFIKKKGLALWDVLKHCTREGSSDSNIKDIEVNDFAALIGRYSGIGCIAFSSQKASQLFYNFVMPDIHQIVEHRVKILLLPSPSGQNAHTSLESKIAAWKQIIDYL